MLLIYHSPCSDGLAAAWCFWKRFGKEVELFGTDHDGAPPPDVTGKCVIMVDFAYPRPIMEDIVAKAASVTVLDHHETTKALVGMPGIQLTLDMKRSGCQLAWDTCFPDERRPPILDAVGNRDLYCFKTPGTREISTALFRLGYYESLERFDYAMTHETTEHLVLVGTILTDAEAVTTKIVAKRAERREMRCPDGSRFQVACLMCEKYQASDVGALLSEEKDANGQYKYDFAVLLNFDPQKGHFRASLRGAAGSPINLSAVAGMFKNGGGHAKSAACTLGTQAEMEAVLIRL